MNQTASHFFHRHAFGLMRLRMRLMHGLIEPRTRAAAQLLGSKSGYVHK